MGWIGQNYNRSVVAWKGKQMVPTGLWATIYDWDALLTEPRQIQEQMLNNSPVSELFLINSYQVDVTYRMLWICRKGLKLVSKLKTCNSFFNTWNNEHQYNNVLCFYYLTSWFLHVIWLYVTLQVFIYVNNTNFQNILKYPSHLAFSSK